MRRRKKLQAAITAKSTRHSSRNKGLNLDWTLESLKMTGKHRVFLSFCTEFATERLFSRCFGEPCVLWTASRRHSHTSTVECNLLVHHPAGAQGRIRLLKDTFLASNGSE